MALMLPLFFRRLLDRIPKPLRNKFVLATIVFVVWMFFFDKNSILAQYALQKSIQELKIKKEYYRRELRETERNYEELFGNDDAAIEKFAREHYLMKKDDEELFVIER